MFGVDGVHRLQSKQWLAALAATLAMINVGAEEFWLLTNLKNVINTDTGVKNKNCFWAGLLLGATSCVIGTFLGAILADRFGRKKTLLATSIFWISQIIGGLSGNRIFSYVALFLGEIGAGITRVVVPLYLSEIVDDNIRGALLILQVPFFYIGKFLAVGRDIQGSTEVVGVVSLIIIGIFLVTFMRFPETPYHLSSKGRNEAAIRSLAFYKSIERTTAEEEIELMRNHEEQDANQECCGKFQELLRPTNRKSLMIIMFLTIVKWSEHIFDSSNILTHVLSGPVFSEEYQVKIVAHATSLIASFLILFTIDRIGRRLVLLSVSLVGFIFVTFVFSFGVRPDYAWLYLVIDVGFYFCELIVLSVMTVFVGELFTANVRALAIAIVTTFNLLTSFLIIAIPEIMAVDITSIIGGWLFLFAFPITFAFIPETKRKSISDIQNELRITWHCRWIMNKFIRTDQSK